MTVKKKVIINLLLIWIILAIIFAFYDLQISEFIANKNSGWANFLECYGMIPGLIVILSGIYISYSSISRKSDTWSYFKKVVFFLAIGGLLFYLTDVLISNIISVKFFEQFVAMFLIISFVLSLVTLIILQFKDPIQNKILIHYSNTVLGMAIFGYVVGIQIVKTFWGRVRFRQLDAAFSQFTPWYLPQGITGFDSFPSGHAAMGWMLLPILILVSNRKVWIKNLSFILIFICAVVLDYSRVVIGAHFASDVLFGSFFIIMTFVIFKNKFVITRN